MTTCNTTLIKILPLIFLDLNRIGGIMASVPVLIAVERVFELLSNKTKDCNIKVAFFSYPHRPIKFIDIIQSTGFPLLPYLGTY